MSHVSPEGTAPQPQGLAAGEQAVTQELDPKELATRLGAALADSPNVRLDTALKMPPEEGNTGIEHEVDLVNLRLSEDTVVESTRPHWCETDDEHRQALLAGNAFVEIVTGESEYFVASPNNAPDSHAPSVLQGILGLEWQEYADVYNQLRVGEAGREGPTFDEFCAAAGRPDLAGTANRQYILVHGAEHLEVLEPDAAHYARLQRAVELARAAAQTPAV